MRDYDCTGGVPAETDDNWERQLIEDDFYEFRYRRQIELKLNEDGTPNFESKYWGYTKEEWAVIEKEREAERQRQLAIQKEIENWKPPTPIDIIEVSAFLFIRNIPFERQHYADKFTWDYVTSAPGNSLRSKYEYCEDKNWCWLRIPMRLFMEMHGISFDGVNYTAGGRTYPLVDMMATVKILFNGA